MYVYNMPYPVRLKLCAIMDSGTEMWRILAGEIGLTALEVSVLERENLRLHGSPTSALLDKWGHSNATVDMLAHKLIAIKCLRSFDVIKHLVSRHILDSLTSDQCLLERVSTNQCSVRREGIIESEDDLPAPSFSFVEPSLVLNSSIEEANAVKHIEKGMPYYSFANITAATNNRNLQNSLGKGKFGSTYKGQLNQSAVAIKILDQMEHGSHQESLDSEVRSLKLIQHQNLVKLLGVSIDGPHLCLVYQYFENKSLKDHLGCRVKDSMAPLSWHRRHTIIRDASHGMCYLHNLSPTPMIHRNIKSSNILLGVNFEAKLGDYGLALKSVESRSMTGTSVTKREQHEIINSLKAYMPDDFFIGGLQHSTATDVYAFGVVIFEICLGRDAHDWFAMKQQRLADFLQDQFSNHEEAASKHILSLKDDTVQDWLDKAWTTLMMLAKKCTSDKKKHRPTAKEISDALEKCCLDVIDYISSSTKDKKKNAECDESFLTNLDKGSPIFPQTNNNFTQLMNKVATTCIRQAPAGTTNTDIYSSADASIPSPPGKTTNLQPTGTNEDAYFNFMSITDDMNNIKAKKLPFVFDLNPILLEDQESQSAEKYNLKSSDKSASLDDDEHQKESDGSAEPMLAIEFTSENGSSAIFSSDNAFNSKYESSISEIDSLLKNLNKKDEERYAKLEKLKEDFPENFSSKNSA